MIDVMTTAKVRMLGPVLLAGALALALTALRLAGELDHWQPAWVFNTAPGGGGSPLGISWLVIPFGVWFGRRLARGGARPANLGRTFLLHVLGIGLFVGLMAYVFNCVDDWRMKGMIASAGGAAIGLVACLAWPSAYFANLGAGILARIPVAAIQYFAVEGSWDVHFAKVQPEVPKEDALFLLTSAQAGLWPFGYSVLLGGFFATLGAATVRKA